MLDGNGLKNKSLNKKRITIYQMPVFERIIGILSSIILTTIPVVALATGIEKKAGMIVLLMCMVVYCIFMYLNVFKTYICLDIENKKLIIREEPGIKKEELFLDNIVEIAICDGEKYKDLFTINIRCAGYTKKVISWSAHPTCRLAMFGVYKRQTKRLKKFAMECNQYLKNR